MTLLRTESFESYAGSTYSGGGGPAPRTGAKTLGNSFAGYGVPPLSAAEEHATLIAGAALYLGSGCDLYGFFGFKANGTEQITVRAAGGRLRVTQGNGGTLLYDSVTNILPMDTWTYMEAKVVASTTVGSLVIRCDETVIVTLTGINTLPFGGTKYNGMDSFIGSGFGLIDDLYLCNAAGSVNNDFLGAVHVEALRPTGNGNASQWTGSDGNSTDNYALVDEATVDIADHVETAIVGNKDTYAFGNSTFSSLFGVKGITVKTRAEKLDGGARNVDLVTRLAGSEQAITNLGPALINGTYGDAFAVFETKPDGGAWTVADANNAEFGMTAT